MFYASLPQRSAWNQPEPVHHTIAFFAAVQLSSNYRFGVLLKTHKLYRF